MDQTNPSRAKLIKRYANRKLYDTERSCYVTLDEIAEMVKQGEDLRIVDNRTGEDLTGVTLTQIIYEDQKKTSERSNGLPLNALRSIIQQGGEIFMKLSTPSAWRSEPEPRKRVSYDLPEETLILQRLEEARRTTAPGQEAHLDALHKQMKGMAEQMESMERQLKQLTRTVADLRGELRKNMGRDSLPSQKSKPTLRL